MTGYEAPKVVELGSLSDLTLDYIHKTSGSGDVIVISGSAPVPVPGSVVGSITPGS